MARYSNIKNNKNKEKFYIILSNALELQTIQSLDDVYNLYKGSFGVTSANDTYRFKLSRLLREFAVEMYYKDNIISYKERIVEWKNKIDNFIRQNDELSPFSGLPQTERNIMIDILVFLEKDEKDAIKRKLNEMSTSIQLRIEQLDKTERLSKWANPLAVIGSVLTILFGVLSLLH